MNLKKVMHVIMCVVFIVLICDGATRRDGTKRSRRRRRLSGRCKPQIMAEYELSFLGGWSPAVYSRMYPNFRPRAQWSKLIGRSHSESYTMWEEGTLATEAVKMFAEEADTSGFDREAQAYGGIRDSFTAAPILAGQGKTTTNFMTDGRHTKVSFMVRLIPSPDWFVGLASFELCQRNKWKRQETLDLYPIDAGTDRGLTFTSPNWPSKPRQNIYKLAPNSPNHSASSFYDINMTSLPPIGRVFIKKISEYRQKGKSLPPLKKERNLVIFGDEDASRDVGDVSRVVEDITPDRQRRIDTVVNRTREESRNEIQPPALAVTTAPTDLGCLVSDWSHWSACSRSCGYGRRQRRRSIIRRASQPGLYCPVLREDQSCNTRSCDWESFKFLKRKG